MSYQDDLTTHLIEYKRKHLGALPAGTYRYRGREVFREHILPAQNSGLSFLEESREEIVAFLRSNPRMRLHKYAHHLNSSQAFALNLFVPFFQGGSAASASLLRAIGQHATLVRWEPESIPDPVEETSLDAMWDTNDGTRTFCEVKLSERDFGKARLDPRHLDKLRDIYLPRLAQHLSPVEWWKDKLVRMDNRTFVLPKWGEHILTLLAANEHNRVEAENLKQLAAKLGIPLKFVPRAVASVAERFADRLRGVMGQRPCAV